MAKRTTTPEYVTRKILKEEISASEQRLGARITATDGKIEITAQSLKDYTDGRFNQLDTKIETTAQSLKDYTDSRFNQLDTRIKTMDSTIKTLDTKIDGMDAKMTRYFEGIGSMLEGLTGTSTATRDRLDNREQRITALEWRRS
jgi:peptidoglycan hydrolase CwlO-like protein